MTPRSELESPSGFQSATCNSRPLIPVFSFSFFFFPSSPVLSQFSERMAYEGTGKPCNVGEGMRTRTDIVRTEEVRGIVVTKILDPQQRYCFWGRMGCEGVGDGDTFGMAMKRWWFTLGSQARGDEI